MQITDSQQKIYDILKAGELLKKHNILEKLQEDRIKKEILKIKNKKNVD